MIRIPGTKYFFSMEKLAFFVEVEEDITIETDFLDCADCDTRLVMLEQLGPAPRAQLHAIHQHEVGGFIEYVAANREGDKVMVRSALIGIPPQTEAKQYRHTHSIRTERRKRFIRA